MRRRPAPASRRESRELVPLRQALAVFGERPGFLRDLTRKDTTDS